MREVCSGEIFARVALAVVFDGREVGPIFCIFNVEPAAFRVQRTISRFSCWGDAVKEVAAILHGVKKVYRVANAEKMARLFLRQKLIYPPHGVPHVFLVKRAADAEAVKVSAFAKASADMHPANCFCAFLTEVLESPALHYPKYLLLKQGSTFFPIQGRTLFQLIVSRERTLCPSVSAFHCFFLILVRRVWRGAFVKREYDIGSEVMLYFNRALGRKAVRTPVFVRPESNAVFVNLRQLFYLAPAHFFYSTVLWNIGIDILDFLVPSDFPDFSVKVRTE